MAARGGVKGGWDYEYSGSNSVGEVAWYGGNSNDKTHDVGTKQPNKAGLYDMSGNVWEWCWNTWSDVGASSGNGRVNRGGGWFSAYCASVSYRHNNLPDYLSINLGFRVCRILLIIF